MTTMTSPPENYNDIRAGIVELLKAARSAAGSESHFDPIASLFRHFLLDFDCLRHVY
jgi:hypothetical protein